ncbi:sensor histidine kinase [Luteipulveratus flavus]|uniref:histidine kinase n=1 Tax=Luteipulveratus flavus TaxID=3031728 RepID=A0ABT6CEE0_9MICO|nr:sensor histidine kinase [Luteipulveratus sp. YIM 133296]MDF8266409.1 sensor histidine kinase [Luteipulveratus sp. YIM 133296]
MNVDSRYDVLRRRPRLLDGIIVGGLLLTTSLVLAVWSWWLTLLSAAIVVPLWWRRTHPVAAAGAMAVFCVLQLATHESVLPADIAPLLAIYATAAYGVTRRRRLIGLALGVAGALIGGLRWGLLGSVATWEDYALRVVICTVALGMSAVGAWILGDLLRSRRAVLSRLQEQNAALERDQEQRAALAAQDERSRIAREMHDVVAHSLSVVVVQADGGAYAARSGSREATTALEAATTTLETIAATAREALAETRRLVGVLRAPDAGLELAPQAGLDAIADVVERTTAAGVPTTLESTGERAPVPRDAELAAYRVVQESLTNVMKHAGPGATAHVRLDHTPDGLIVAVTDDGLGAAVAHDGAGHGILGMRERVTVYGGTLHAGPRRGPGFAVTATIPVSSDVPAPTTTGAAS